MVKQQRPQRNPKHVGENDLRIVYDVPEAGALLGLSRGAAYEAVWSGVIPSVRVGRLLKVPRRAFHEKFGT